MMRRMIVLGVLACLVMPLAACKKKEPAPATPPKPAGSAATTPSATPSTTAPAVTLASLDKQTVELGCGRCTYKMKGVSGCPTAALVAGQPVLLGGEKVAPLGHAFCGKPGKAVVSGTMEGGKLVVTDIEVVEQGEGHG